MRIILHIGPMKTGTTAVQRRLFADREALRKAGVIYPESGLLTDDPWGPRHKRLGKTATGTLRNWAALEGELERSGAEVAVISWEGFWRQRGQASVIRDRLAAHEVRIVALLRRQDRLLGSWYQQSVLGRGYTGSVNDHWAERREDLDYVASLGAWAAEFGDQAIRVGLFPEPQIEQDEDAVSRFARLADIPLARQGAPVKENTSATPQAVETMRMVNALKPSPDLRARLLPLFRREALPASIDRGELLGAELAAEVLEAYRPSNQDLFARRFDAPAYEDALWNN